MGSVYVALGDSMSIDDYAGGVGRGAANLFYRNRGDDFPDWAGHDLYAAGFTAQILARDGATAVDVLERQLPLLQQEPDLVTVMMGGNDLLAAYGDTPAGEAAIGRVAAVGEGILRRLRATTGGRTRILVATVYDLSDGTGTAGTAGLTPWPDGPALIQSLNTVLSEMAGRHADVADVHAHFFGHGSTAGDPAQTQARPANRDLWYCGVVEPNAWGAHEIRSVWWNTVTESGWLPPLTR
jgi:lysophospholipase L1-like esterase